MKVKIQYKYNGDIIEEEIKPIYICKHVLEDINKKIEDIKFDESSEYILIENIESPYGYSALLLKDKVNKIYEYDGFGHSGACSIITALLKENKQLKEELWSWNKRNESWGNNIK